MDYNYQLSPIEAELAANIAKAEQQRRYFYYSQVANRLRHRVGGCSYAPPLDPTTIVQIKHIYDTEKETLEYSFSEVALEDSIFNSIRIDNQ